MLPCQTRPNTVAPTMNLPNLPPAPLRVTPRELSALWRHDLPESRCGGGDSSWNSHCSESEFIWIHLNYRDLYFQSSEAKCQNDTNTWRSTSMYLKLQHWCLFQTHPLFIRCWATRLPSGFSWDWYLPSTSAGRISSSQKSWQVGCGEDYSLAISWHIYQNIYIYI